MTSELGLQSTGAILGSGFPGASLQPEMARQPHVLGVDDSSIDPGPHYPGSGKPFCSSMAIRHDLPLMLNAAVPAGISVVIGTCGGVGGEPQLELVAGMAREIAREDSLHFRMALIHAEQSGNTVMRPACCDPRCSPACIGYPRSTCCSPSTTRHSHSRRRCRAWSPPATSATSMSTAASSMPRCWMLISRSESASP